MDEILELPQEAAPTPAETAAAALAQAGITVEARPVTYNVSELSKLKLSDMQVKWWVTVLYKGNPILSTSYQTGIGHLKNYKWNTRPTNEHRSHVIEAIQCTGPSWGNKLKRVTPLAVDVMFCLLNDADAIDYSGFEDWANCYGFDTDSRSAEAIYKACMETALKLRAALGGALLLELREAFHDY